MSTTSSFSPTGEDRDGLKIRVTRFDSEPGHTARTYRPRGEAAIDRVRAFVDSSPGPGSCWPFLGTLTRDGYGRVNCGPRTLLAHKVVLETKLGRPLARGEVSRHGRTCWTRTCCNPDHLQPGTIQDNAADRIAFGQRLLGERCHTAKITCAQASEIIRLAATMGRGKYEALGRRFGISGKQVSNICSGKRWPHLTRGEHERIRRLAAQVAAGELTLAAAEKAAVRP